ncbi:MAG TPA: GNAT family N-acetyltransferase [Anaerolineales bacterium]|nr:GNAT family N-acetyltransferase [Anaerolineales bacterium]
MTALRRLTPEDLPRLRQFWIDQWAGPEMIVHGDVFRPEQLEGFVNEDWSGLVTYVIGPAGCEIISLDSLKEGGGTGSALIDAVADEATRRGCTRLFLSTTNDNLRALGFYQRRGFELVSVRRGAVTESRKRKPGIPLIGDNEIPVRDEIELELRLPAERNPGRGG